MSTYFITGCGGFVGSHLADKLLLCGHKVIGLDLAFNQFWLDTHSNSSFTPVVGSILDHNLVQKLIASSDVVVHLAAIASPQSYVDNPKRTIDINLNASLSIIEALRFTGKPLFFTSTSEVFGRNTKVPWSETSDRILGPSNINRWCYSTSKAMIEHYLYACAQEGSISFSGVRIFNCYGPRLAGRVVDRFVNAAIRSQPLTIHGDGSQTRCFTYIDDLISAIYALLIQPSKVNKFFNIGSDVEVSINELAHLICDICSLDPEKFINYVSHKEAIGSSYEDIDRRVPDCSLARRELSWTYHIPLREGLAKMIEYERMVYQGFRSASALSSETDE